MSRRFIHFNLNYAPVFLLCFAALIWSCQTPTGPAQYASGTLTPLVATSVFETPVSIKNQISIVGANAAEGNTQLAVVNEMNCEKTAIKASVSPLSETSKLQSWTLTLYSPVGIHDIAVHFAPGNPYVHVDVDSRHIELQVDAVVGEDDMVSLCEQKSAGEDELKVKTEHIGQVLSAWLVKVAPDCTITPAAKGFRCDFAPVDPVAAQQDLTEIRRTMVRSWSRQPYVITRRLSVAVNLAQALVNQDASRSLDVLCRSIAHGDPLEMPLAIASQRWQESVCLNHNADRFAAAQLGLSKALVEIEFLRQLFERTSKLGNLTVRIPRDIAPTRDLWINLKPGPDVVQQLAVESENLGAKLTATADADFKKLKACWHPLFGGNKASLRIARYLDLTGEAAGLSCGEEATQLPIADAPSLYLADSITSETEFVLGNGQSKMLRLPAGSYSYEIRGHYDSLGWEATADERSSAGEIVWASKRPTVIIRTW